MPGSRAVRRACHYTAAYARFVRAFFKFKKLSRGNSRFRVEWQHRFPKVADQTTSTLFDRHYVYHPAWAARVLSETRPEEHIDISSTLYFCALVSAFLPVTFYDYRPAKIHLSRLTSRSADLLSLPFADRSIRSLSCMHVVEHIGLGRYGDRLDPDGDTKAIHELARVLAIGGSLLFVVPVGRPQLLFNAHRIYSYEDIVSAFSALELRQFALISEHGSDGLIYDAPRERVAQERYGCGCFWFVRPNR